MKSPKIELSELQGNILKKISNQKTSSVREVERAGLVLLLGEGLSNIKISARTGLSWEKAQRWRYRWISYESIFREIEKDKSNKRLKHEMELKIRECLSDAARPGSPGKFSSETYCQILGVSLELPEQSGRPISVWTLDELKSEVENRQIVQSISRAQLGSFLKNL